MVGRSVKSLLSRPEMPICGAHRQTNFTVVCKQTGTSTHQMDESLS